MCGLITKRKNKHKNDCTTNHLISGTHFLENANIARNNCVGLLETIFPKSKIKTS